MTRPIQPAAAGECTDREEGSAAGFVMSRYAILQGQVLEHLRTLETDSLDAMLSDPPYGLGNKQPTPGELVAYLSGAEMDTGGDFMGKDWHVPSVQVWREIFRVLKPGAPVMAFAGSRTSDLISLGMRAAGFEIRDVLMWVYASGFPKSQNTSKAIDAAAGAVREVIGINEDYSRRKPNGMQTAGATAYGYSQSQQETDARITAPATDAAKKWDGYGSALKPAFEPIILARKPLAGTMVENVTVHGCGPLAIDASRIGEAGGGTHCTNRDENGKCRGHNNGGLSISGDTFHAANALGDVGRWPANVILDEIAGAILDEQSGDRRSATNKGPTIGGKIFNGGKGIVQFANGAPYAGESGGASRFFFCPKVSKKEREKGCNLLPMKSAGECTDREEGSAGAGRGGGSHNHHPTLKPIALIKYLATMIRPPTSDAVLLIPYCGSGSEIIGALQAGWPAVLGIEREPDYIANCSCQNPRARRRLYTYRVAGGQ